MTLEIESLLCKTHASTTDDKVVTTFSFQWTDYQILIMLLIVKQLP